MNRTELHPACSRLLHRLGASPLRLSRRRIQKLRTAFPVPQEHRILWADAEFDLRPSGIVCTDRGLLIRSNISPFAFDAEARRAALYYYCWDSFDPGWFTEADPDRNRALLVEKRCAHRFVEACRSLSAKESPAPDARLAAIPESEASVLPGAPLVSAAASLNAPEAVFAEQKSRLNTSAGHGEMAEEANTLLDRLCGLDAVVTGRNNARDGADRQIGQDVLIQSKYCKTAGASLDACFDGETGLYRYMKDGKPMQLEVPSDQYVQVLEALQRKIREGKVPNVSDPSEARQIVRKGRLSYRQAVNLTRPGTVESLVYDVLSGTVVCSCAFGLSFVAAAFLRWQQTRDLKDALRTGFLSGAPVFGLSLLQHVLQAQFSRSAAASFLNGPGVLLAERMDAETARLLVNGLRSLTGQPPLGSTAAVGHLAKLLRSHALSALFSIAVFSIPDVYRVAVNRISGAQFSKNISVLAASVAGGAGGVAAAGAAAASLSAAAGTAIAPGLGTAVGIAAGFIGGAIAGKAADLIGDFLCEDDIFASERLLNAVMLCMIGEYMLSEAETDALIAALNDLPADTLGDFLTRMHQEGRQEDRVRAFLEPHFEAVVGRRTPFSLPGHAQMYALLAAM